MVPADSECPVKLPLTLQPALRFGFQPANVLGETIAWTAPALADGAAGIPANLFGALVATNEEPRKILFGRPEKRTAFAQTIELDGPWSRMSQNFFRKI